jgi:hypothetical protein
VFYTRIPSGGSNLAPNSDNFLCAYNINI